MMKIKVKTESSFIRGLSLFFLVVGVVTFTVSYIYSESLAAPGAWPTDSQWTLVTSNGSVIADEEEQASCLDSTRNAAVSGSIDLASQADCSGPAPHYNPGNNGQPGATHQNTFTFGNYYEDQNNDSNSCINISDDYVFFRIRLAGDPYQAQAVNGFNNVIYFVLIDADADGDTDFYLRLNGNGDKASETFEILYETTADNDPTGEPVVHSHLNPINNGFARAFATPDNGIVGDSAQYFIDLQVPVTDFDDNLGAQVLCSGVVTLANVMTSQNVNDPDQKDFKLGLGTYSDPIIFDPPEYQVTKTAVDVNGGSLVPGDVVEYTATLTNLAGSLSDIVFTDVLPVGSTFVPNAYGAGSGIQVTLGTNTYNMSNAVDSQDTGGCSTATKCKADLTGSTVNFSNDFLYAKGSVTPLYDDIVIKFQTIYATSGTFVNQSTTTTHELPNIRYSDDPGVDDTIDCTTASVDNCNDGITGNDDTTNVTVISAPELSTSTKTDDDVDNSVLPGQTVTYTTTLINTGNETGTGINIDDTIDANSENLANFTFTDCGSSYTNLSSSPTVDINLLEVAVGINCVVTYDVDVKTPLDEGTTIDNQVTISAAAEGGSGATPSSDTLIVDATPNLSGSTKVDNDGDNIIAPGQTITYFITLINDGDGSATGVDIDDIIDINTENLTNFTFTDCGSSYVNSSVSPTVDINGLEVAIGTNCIVAYDVDVKTPLNEGTNIDNQVTIFPSIEGGAGSTPGIYTISTPSSDTIIVDATPNLSTSTKVDDDADNFVDPGQTVTYTTTLINTGDGTGTGINIDDTIDTNTNGLTNFTFTDCGSSYVNSSVSPTVDINGLEVAIGTNCIVTYDITVKSSTTLGTTINNQTTISSATEGGPGATPSSDTLTSNGTVPDLSSSTKLDDDADNEVITGQLVRYTILLKNIGGQTATGVSTTDNLDSKLKNISSVALENCGSSYVDNSTSSPNIISIDDLEILNTIDCTIEFSGTVKTGYVGEIISNVVTISAAAEGGSGSTAISDNLAIANTAPDAKNDATSTNEDTAVTINVLDNDTDVDGNLNPATLAIATEPENGTVTVNNETGKINYTPDEGFVGTDTFKYQICDDDGLCDTAKVEVTVNPVEEENPSYNLNIFKVADPPNGEIVVPRNLLYPGSPGTIITYIMTVTNDSNSTVTNVVISDMIGDGMLYIPGSLVYEDVNLTDQAGDDRGDYNETELGMVTYFAGDLAPGDTRVAFFKIEVAEYSEAIPDLINKPACTSDQVICEVTSDPVVHPVDPFEVYKTVEDLNSGLVESGDKLKYTLRVVNIGHTPTTTVIVTDDLPDEITYVAGSITGLGADDSNTDILKWNIGIMAVGAEEIVTFEATVNAGVARSTVINNVGSVSSDQNTTPKVSSVETAKVITDVALAGTGSDTRPLRYTGMLLIIFGLALLGFTLYNPKEQIVQTMKVNSKKR